MLFREVLCTVELNLMLYIWLTAEWRGLRFGCCRTVLSSTLVTCSDRYSIMEAVVSSLKDLIHFCLRTEKLIRFFFFTSLSAAAPRDRQQDRRRVTFNVPAWLPTILIYAGRSVITGGLSGHNCRDAWYTVRAVIAVNLISRKIAKEMPAKCATRFPTFRFPLLSLTPRIIILTIFTVLSAIR